MTLATIKQNFLNRQYSTILEFWKDVAAITNPSFDLTSINSMFSQNEVDWKTAEAQKMHLPTGDEALATIATKRNFSDGGFQDFDAGVVKTSGLLATVHFDGDWYICCNHHSMPSHYAIRFDDYMDAENKPYNRADRLLRYVWRINNV